jgi:hypothetical protein
MGALGADPSTIKSITINARDLQEQISWMQGNAWYLNCSDSRSGIVNGVYVPGPSCPTWNRPSALPESENLAFDGTWGPESQKALFDGVNQMTPYTRSITGNPAINTTPYYRTNARKDIVRLPVLWFSDPNGLSETPDPTRADRAVSHGGPGYGYGLVIRPTPEQLADWNVMLAEYDARARSAEQKAVAAAALARKLAAPLDVNAVLATPPQPGLDTAALSSSSSWVAATSVAAVLLGLSLWAWAAQKHN